MRKDKKTLLLLCLTLLCPMLIAGGQTAGSAESSSGFRLVASTNEIVVLHGSCSSLPQASLPKPVNPKITLTVTNNFAKHLPISYTYTVTAGQISPDNDKATWDLTGLSDGTYRATVYAKDAANVTFYDFVNVIINEVVCDPPPPPLCPEVSVTVLEQDIHIVAFKAQIQDIDNTPLTYAWTLSKGTIVKGQNSPEIIVDVTGLEGSLTATVSVSGLPSQCLAQKSMDIDIPRQIFDYFPFDHFSSRNFEDDKPRLDNFAIELEHASPMQGVITAYSTCEGNALARAAQQKNYLVKVRGTDPKRLLIQDGGCRETREFVLEILPEGFNFPFDKSTNPCRPCRRRKKR